MAGMKKASVTSALLTVLALASPSFGQTNGQEKAAVKTDVSVEAYRHDIGRGLPPPNGFVISPIVTVSGNQWKVEPFFNIYTMKNGDVEPGRVGVYGFTVDRSFELNEKASASIGLEMMSIPIAGIGGTTGLRISGAYRGGLDLEALGVYDFESVIGAFGKFSAGKKIGHVRGKVTAGCVSGYFYDDTGFYFRGEIAYPIKLGNVSLEPVCSFNLSPDDLMRGGNAGIYVSTKTD